MGYVFTLCSTYVEPLLCNDCEMSKYTRAVSGQHFGKDIPAASDKNATVVQQQRNGVLYGSLRGCC
jgi:hypothetical protein